MLARYLDIIMHSPVFIGLGPNEMESIFENRECSIRKYEKNEYVVFEGDECRHLRFVVSGSVKGEMLDFSGRAIKIEDIYPPMPLAPAFLFGNQNLYPVSIIANEETRLLVIPKESMIGLMLADKRILINYLNFMSNRAQFLSRKLKFLSFQTIKGKIAHYILQLSRNNDQEIILDKSQNELSELFGVTRPSLGRVVRELHNEGVINVNGKRIFVRDREKLARYLK